MTTAIKIERLSKKYMIGHQRQERYTTLREVMMHNFRGLGQRFRHPLSPNSEVMEQEEFWALRNINLEIRQGDRIGIMKFGSRMDIYFPASDIEILVNKGDKVIAGKTVVARLKGAK